MVAIWPSWLSGQSLPLRMKYSRYVHCINCHCKQDAKAIFDGYNNQLSTKSVERATRSIKENLWKNLDGSKYANCISAGRFLEQCREKSPFDNVPDQPPHTWLSRCPTIKIRWCFHGRFLHYVRYNQLYMLRHSNSNTTVFDITRLLNLVGKC